ncbi:hypothetical protein J2Z31_005479 [Sinorhizobium kostiense]|uniref:Uncharacterized protein n=1 Tax=Sinorhizobium kostiense TaxID=76747 RepID=A0ABS4R7R8_9HYPH|nr:hypothetical protein [Sinorhizobium kostiense]
MKDDTAIFIEGAGSRLPICLLRRHHRLAAPHACSRVAPRRSVNSKLRVNRTEASEMWMGPIKSIDYSNGLMRSKGGGVEALNHKEDLQC